MGNFARPAVKYYEFVRPMQWAGVPSIAEAQPLSPNERACLSEVRKTLERHGRLDKFGVCLIHKPFEIQPDEALLEEVDVKNRVLTTKPVKRDAINPLRATETQWRLTNETAVVFCAFFCLVTDGRHSDIHVMNER
jgi:hypothetical protein